MGTMFVTRIQCLLKMCHKQESYFWKLENFAENITCVCSLNSWRNIVRYIRKCFISQQREAMKKKKSRTKDKLELRATLGILG